MGGGGGGFDCGGDNDLKRVCDSTVKSFRGARSTEDIDSGTELFCELYVEREGPAFAWEYMVVQFQDASWAICTRSRLVCGVTGRS